MTEIELYKEFRISDFKTFTDFLLNKITELENQIADIKANCDLAIEGRDIKIQELEKENAELKSELTKKADTNHSLVEQMADLEQENTELKKELAFRRYAD